MRKTAIALSLITISCAAASAFASGYRIPEQSLNATALSSAYLANANRADAAFYNPANMSWLEQGTLVDGGLTYIHLPSVSYEDFRTSAYNGESEAENFVIPNLHMVSPEMNNFRLGFSLVSPAGLAKRWEDPFPRTFAREFSMTVIEAAPSVSYKINDMISVAGGVRFVYSKATVKSDGTIIVAPPSSGSPSPEYATISRDMDGDTYEYGYNLALSVKPIDNLSVGITYRSKVDLDMDGDGTMTVSQSFPSGMIPAGYYNGDGSVSVPLPAILAVGVAYTIDRSTIEFEYDRTFWSDYETLDFKYPTSLGHPVLSSAFDAPITKDWEDVDAYRLGYTFKWDKSLTLMAGVGIDGNPIPDSSLSFDLPDSNAWFISFGGRYDINDKLSVGAAYLYADKKDRTVQNKTLNGEFSGQCSHLFAVSASYIF